jgi:hypothetical protein
MSKFLKGNYPIKNSEADEPDASKTRNITKKFEEKALEKLGGSIAFVMKSNTFLWDEEEEK